MHATELAFYCGFIVYDIDTGAKYGTATLRDPRAL
jgi:hypothetical protein